MKNVFRTDDYTTKIETSNTEYEDHFFGANVEIQRNDGKSASLSIEAMEDRSIVRVNLNDGGRFRFRVTPDGIEILGKMYSPHELRTILTEATK